MVSGVTTPAPENLPDAGATTIFYDAKGNIVGKLHSGFFPPPGKPNVIWYRYENGQYVEISQEPLTIYDDQNRPVIVTSADGSKTFYSYGEDGSKTVIEMDPAGKLLSAIKNLPDGRTEIYKDLETEVFTSTTPESAVFPSPTVLFSRITDEEFGAGFRITGFLEGTTLLAKDLEEASRILGIPVAQGLRMAIPPNIADAADETWFYDASGNAIGVVFSGGYRPAESPQTSWYRILPDGMHEAVLDIYDDGSQELHLYSKSADVTQSHTVIRLDPSGNPTGATRENKDGTREVFTNVTKILLSQSTCDASGQVCSELSASMIDDPNAVEIGYQTVSTILPDGSKQTSSYLFTGYLAEVQNPDGSKTLYAYGKDGSKTVIQMDKDGKPLSAVKEYTDGTLETFGDLQLEGGTSTTPIMAGGERVTIWHYESGDEFGTWQSITGVSKGRTLTEQAIQEAEKLLGVDIESGITVVPGPGIEDAPIVTSYYDAAGNLIAQNFRGGYHAEDSPDPLWMLYFQDGGNKLTISMDGDGKFLSAVRTYSDGKVETFDHLQRSMIKRTTCSADGLSCSVLAASMKYDPNVVQLGSQTVSTVLSDGSKQTTTYLFTGYLAEVKNPDGSTVTHIYGDNYVLAVEMSADGDVTSALLTYGRNTKLDVTDVYGAIEKEGAEGISKLLADLEDLKTRLGVSGLDIKVTNFAQVTWNNGCVGWYSPGQMCTMALVTGYSTTFEIEGVSFEYHAGRLDPAIVTILKEVSSLSGDEKLAKIKELVAALDVPTTK